ncbi:MAG: tRNA lysidine(34) synthetase TilS, partial [Pirellulales bacterium]|nr:tRNA lysidine(34) synthetase TilS [Pirellulales bacterium]
MQQNQKSSDSWRDLLSKFVLAWPPQRWRDVGLVVGCSGGADSVALLRAVCQARLGENLPAARGFVVAAHFDHGLRGEESRADANFVRQLAEQLEVDFQLGQSRAHASDESTLRSDRLEFLQHTAEKCGARYVALA